MRERPILFSGSMVRAILDGTKTQTRRVVKLTPALRRMHGDLEQAWKDHGGPNNPFAVTGEEYLHVPCATDVEGTPSRTTQRLYSPYGVPGDLLWVRETWQVDAPRDGTWGDVQFYGCKDSPLSDIPTQFRNPTHILYRATWDGFDLTWRPSIHMPRWASRLTLTITDVRVERLQEITEDDAKAEGVAPLQMDHGSYISRFHGLWDTLNAARGFGWDANPWVWVVSFKRMEEPR